MAKFLTTTGNSYHIEDIIINAKKSLTLVTPFLKLSKNLIERISDADKKDIHITLIYGKSELDSEQHKILFSLKNIDIYYFYNLHAKCYHNENSMIITSMNLYEFSEKNNREMGILIHKDTDYEIFNDSLIEIESIINNSELKLKLFNENKSNDNSKEIDYEEFEELRYKKVFKNLKDLFDDYKITYNDFIEIKNFPIPGINLEVKHRINVIIENYDAYYKIMSELKGNFNNLLGRYYWNRNEINIYPEREFFHEYNLKGLDISVEKDLSIIKSVYNILQENHHILK
ncbi:phospholipase D family protein [Ichthyenterobacterium magnum]|uniref:Phospholipase D-like protein n=1 Tax=Ichthyenterobacterium magnum TaxID=1230530 RepID=A0A420DLL8_9FLAO|nr:phospholipase D family protein [Ichthyenterobacterium magnum]RKE95098.1 phospholipase D-like protein [Ichthyenterobacterium magnum]